MTNFLVFASGMSQADAHAQCAALISTIDAALGFPTPDGQTRSYSFAIDHPDIHVFETAMVVTEEGLPYLTQGQIDSLLTPDQMQAAGWQLYQGPGTR